MKCFQELGSLVSPAIVPLLSLLSRVSAGPSAAASDTAVVVDFKRAFFALALGSPVINVRKLAARHVLWGRPYMTSGNPPLNALTDPPLTVTQYRAIWLQ